MDNLSELLLQAKTLVIFKSLHEQPVFKKFLTAAQACLGDDKDDAISKYCDFVSELYAYSDDLTEYILKLVLENENLFMLRKGEGKPTGVLLEECLASELETIQELSEVHSAELAGWATTASCPSIKRRRWTFRRYTPTEFTPSALTATASIRSTTFSLSKTQK